MTPAKLSHARIQVRLRAGVLAGLLLAGCGGDAPRLRVENDRNDASRVTVVARLERAEAGRLNELHHQPGWDAFAPGVLSASLVDRGTNKPVGGAVELLGRELRFKPSLPLLPGARYEIRFRPALLRSGPVGTPDIVLTHQVPATTAPVPILAAVYPTTNALPANHLKFYLEFTEPMRPGEMLAHCRLLRTDGSEVPEPFRETELWSRDGKRLTLWFHPGRQKTGVNLNVEIGAVLDAGMDYTLVIDGAWPSAAGVPLGRDYRKPFRARPADHAPPAITNWRLEPPPAGTRLPVRLEFPESLDWAILHGGLHVEDERGTRAAGEVAVANGETAWIFTPSVAWRLGRWRVSVPTALEDMAGNSIARPFETEAGAATPPVPGRITLPFVVVEKK